MVKREKGISFGNKFLALAAVAIALPALLAAESLFAAEDERFPFNEDETLTDTFGAGELNPHLWEWSPDTENTRVERLPNLEKTDDGMVRIWAEGKKYEQVSAGMVSAVDYPVFGPGQIEQVRIRIKREVYSHPGKDNYSSYNIILAAFEAAPGATAPGAGFYVMFAADSEYPDWGRFGILCIGPDGKEVFHDLYLWSSAEGVKPPKEMVENNQAIFANTFSMGEWHEFRISISASNGMIRLVKDGIPLVSWWDLGNLFFGQDVLKHLSFNPLNYNFQVGVGLIVSDLSDPQSNEGITVQVAIDEIETTLSRFPSSHIIPPLVGDRTEKNTSADEYSKPIQEVDVGLDSGNMTLSASPPSVGVMGERYTPTMRYFTQGADPNFVVNALKTADTFGEPSFAPTSLSARISVAGADYDLEFASAAEQMNLAQFVHFERGGVSNKYLGFATYSFQTSYDYKVEEKNGAYFKYEYRVNSVTGGVMPALDLTKSPYGRGWMPEDLEQIEAPDVFGGSLLFHVAGMKGASIYGDTGILAGIGPANAMSADGESDFVYITADKKRGNVYITNTSRDNVYSFNARSSAFEVDPEKEPSSQDKPGIILLENVGSVPAPGQAAVDDSGGVFVPSTRYNTLYKSTGTGGFVRMGLYGDYSLRHYLSKPSGAVFGPDGKLYVSNLGSNNIVEIKHLDKSGAKIADYARVFAGSVYFPVALAYDEEKNYLYVLHKDRRGLFKISYYDLDAPLPELHTVVTLEFCRRPNSMDFRDGVLFVSDSESGRIYEIYPEAPYSHTFVEKPGSSLNGVAYLPMEKRSRPTGGKALYDLVITVDTATDTVEVYASKAVFKNEVPDATDKIFRGGDGNLQRKLKHGSVIHFDDEGFMDYREDRNGNRFRYSYDQDRRLTTVTDPRNGVWTFMPKGAELSVSDPAKRKTVFSFDAPAPPSDPARNSGRVTKVKFPAIGDDAPLSYGYSYDDRSLVTARTDRNGKTAYFNYDEDFGRLTGASVLYLDGTASFGFEPRQLKQMRNIAGGPGSGGNPAEPPPPQSDSESSLFSDPKSNSYNYSINEYGRLLSETRPDGRSTTVVRDEKNRPLKVIGPDGTGVSMTYDGRGNVTSFTTRRGKTYFYEYDEEFNFVTWMVDPLGRPTGFDYDGRGNLKKITRYAGGSSSASISESFDYNENGLLTSYENPRGKTSGYSYNGRGNLSDASLPGGKHIGIGYDDFGNYATVTGPGNAVRSYSYNDLNRLVVYMDPEGRGTKYYYDSEGNLTQAALPGGRSFEYGYDAAGNLKWRKDPVGAVWNYGYDANFNLETLTDPKQRSWNWEYDELNRAKSVAGPDGARGYEYDPAGRLTKYTDPAGLATSYAYDADGNPFIISPPGIAPVMYEYDDVGNTVSAVDSNSEKWLYDYDGFDRLKRTTDPRGNAAEYARDANGNVTAATNALGRSWSYDYDDADRVEAASDPLANKTSYSYDARDNVTQTVDANGEKTVSAYDRLDRQITFQREDGPVFSYSYDAAGFLSATEADGQRIEYDYDKNGRVTERRRAGYAPETFEYDKLGNMVSYTRRDGTRIEYELDGLDHPASVKFFGVGGGGIGDPGSLELRTEYDNIGRLTSAENGAGNAELSYDAATGRLARIESEYLGVGEMKFDEAFVFDGNGNIVNSIIGIDLFLYDRFESPGAFSRNPLGQIEKMTTLAGDVSYEYDALGLLAKELIPNGLKTVFEYDTADRLTRMETKPSYFTEFWPPLSGMDDEGYPLREFERDATGRITKTTETMPYEIASMYNGSIAVQPSETRFDTEYKYDKQGRLSEFAMAALFPGDSSRPTDTILPNEKYDYDQLGNRTKLSRTKADVAYLGGWDGIPIVENNYVYDGATRQLTEDDKFSYEYEANGNLAKKKRKWDGAITEYRYDPFDRLIEVGMVSPGGPMLGDDPPSATSTHRLDVRYEYDWAGRRVKKSVSTPEGEVTTRYVYDGENLVAEMDGSWNVIAVYIHNPDTIDRPVAMMREGQKFYYIYDERGSVVEIVNEKAHIIQKYTYDSFGNIVLQEGNLSNPFTYTGRQWDAEAGLYHYRARAYDPETGRFLQHDPMESVVPYIYVENDPINFTDPYGEFILPPLPTEAAQAVGEGISKAVKKGWKKITDWWSEPTYTTNLSKEAYESVEITKQMHSKMEEEFQEEYGDLKGYLYYNYLTTSSPTVGPGMNWRMGIAVAEIGASEIPQNKGQMALLATNVALSVVPAVKGAIKTTRAAEKATAAGEVVAEAEAAYLSGVEVNVGSGNAYSVVYRTTLPSDAFPGKSRPFHYRKANQALLQEMNANPQFAESMEQIIPGIREQLAGPQGGISNRPPIGWTWHHNVETGVVELVPTVQHTTLGNLQNLLHPYGIGGMATWGQ